MVRVGAANSRLRALSSIGIAVNNVIMVARTTYAETAWPANPRGEAALLVSLRSKQKSATVALPIPNGMSA